MADERSSSGLRFTFLTFDCIIQIAHAGEGFLNRERNSGRERGTTRQGWREKETEKEQRSKFDWIKTGIQYEPGHCIWISLQMQ